MVYYVVNTKCSMDFLFSAVEIVFQPNENAVDFANRVKKEIAMRGGLVDLQWDGQLKRSRVPTKLILNQQQKFV